MRVLILHDRYSDALPNGENAVVRWEAEGLAAMGVTVRLVETPPGTLDTPEWRRGLMHLGGIYSLPWHRRMRREIEEFRPDIVHTHNLWPHMTPSVYAACRGASIPVVQTLHNYRLLCIADFLNRNGEPCALCIGKRFDWPGVRYRCVEGSAGKSLLKATAIGIHKVLGNWNRMVDAFVVPSEYMRAKFVRGGVDESKLFVKATCAPDVGEGTQKGGYFCFAGRLRYEKGIRLLLEAWRDVSDLELRIAGAGPLEDEVRAAAAVNPSIRFLGLLSPDGVAELMQGALATLVPSTWEEPCPVTMVQSYSAGTPVIASDLGPRSEMVTHGETGLIFPSNDAPALQRHVRWAAGHPDECNAMGRAARERYVAEYSISGTCARLVELYKQTTARTAH